MGDDLSRILAADPEAGLELLLRHFQDRVFSFSLALCGDRGEAEEVTQETFISAWRALRRWPAQRRAELTPSPWLNRIALNLVRRRRRRRPDLELLEAGMSGGIEPAMQFEQRGRLDRLAGLVAALPPAQRDVIGLRCVAGLSYREAALILRRPESTLRSDLHRGLATLRRRRAAVLDLEVV
ncbi:MAG TPA: RNA polymerase sigma factor [Candidatus Nitrosotalea sp.]|nr:RNA polymerase sigma factor [Candidatus Nitrosotalea sp.]